MSALVSRGLGISSEVLGVTPKGLAWTTVQFRQYGHRDYSSAPSPGTGEPPNDETEVQRGVEASSVQSGETEVGRKNVENTSVSNLDAGDTTTGQEKPKPKKSRTGGDMSDEGQVHTPHLGRTRSTRDIIQSKGREMEERLAAAKKSH